MTLFKNLGFEDGSVGGPGAASSWGISSVAAIGEIASYFGNGGQLLPNADTMVGGGWTVIGGGSLASNTIDGPPGLGVLASVFTDAVATAQHGMLISVLSSPGIPTDHAAVSSCWVRKIPGGPVDFARISFDTVDVWLDLTTGNVGTVTGTQADNASAVAVGDDWYRVSVVFPRAGSFGYSVTGQAVDGDFTYLGTGVETIQVFGPQVNVGPLLTSWESGTTGGGELPFENFESLWTENDGYSFDLDDATSTVGLYDTLLVTTKAFEDFEEIWLSNDAYLFQLGTTTTAVYEGGSSPQNFEDFEEEWLDNDSYLFVLGAVTAALYDVANEAFENFEDEWTDPYHLTLASAGSTAAVYDGTELFEDFEEVQAPIVFTAAPGSNKLLAVGHPFVNGVRVNLISEGVLPFGLSKDVDYVAAAVTANDFEVHVNGVQTTFTDPGGGTHRATGDKSLLWTSFMSTV